MKHLKQTCPDSYIFYMTPYKENYSGYTHQSKNEANYYLNDVRMAIIETAKIYDIDVLDLYKYGRFEENTKEGNILIHITSLKQKVNLIKKF